ncbi:glycosyl hydrolase family 8 [Asticcacaulis sp. EMRT-3]|uniref:glycosyl hydrolase family 8 n=1 Tax=Asticcacaulis sp. EMRT-3 TaxID=3040349 RepID=UPI0024AF995B|nr:glycosyl hydrolase family 8 [Asticcacaulis sp. EMRT-3]MDI7775523.1 glycosyl hydrolase family 8 [Asticcacaulis sp. EMRT-3]
MLSRVGLFGNVTAIIMLAALPVHAETQAASTPPPMTADNGYVDAPQGPFARHPGDGNGAYKTHIYHNLFAERLGVSPAATRQKVEATFQQLFHGDGQEQRVYFETGANANGTLAYITDWANNDVRTEGMSYGMMIAVELGKKREFDALWNWAHTYMLTTDPHNPSLGYFAWSMNTDGTPRSTSAAPDGEEYFTMALYFAANRWGNGKGIYNYQAEADKILRDMRHHPVLTGTTPFRIHPKDPPFVAPQTPWPSLNNRAMQAQAEKDGTPWPPYHFDNKPHQVTVGPMVDEAHTMIRFVPETNVTGTDASYHLPAFYELWARWGPKEDRAFWARAADVSRDLFDRVTAPQTGLAPDRSHFDGSTLLTRDGQPDPFGYDSWRTVSNWSVDYSWWGKDDRERALSNRIQTFLYGQGINSFADRYTLDGKPLSTRHSVGMVATTAVGSLAATPGAVPDAFLKTLWDTPVPSGEQRYFDGMLYMMSLMHLSGEFRIIEPHDGKAK